MNTIGIDDNLNRDRIRKLLIIGLFGSVLTGIGDFLLGYAEELPSSTLATQIMAGAPNLSDFQLIAGGLLGVFGLFIEGLSFFAVYRLMADAAPKYAHIYRASIFGYIWLAPIGCHMNVGFLDYAYKYLLQADTALAELAAEPMFYGFCVPVYILLMIFWIPGIVVQFLAFSKSYTPYPKYARWFNLIVGGAPALLLAVVFGGNTALGAGIGTMFLSFGNALTFGGLLATLPSQEKFDAFKERLHNENV